MSLRSLISSSAFNAKFSSAFLGAVRSPVLGSTNSTRSKRALESLAKEADQDIKEHKDIH